ncbi:hypothetical protein MRX96_009989 [Rhipicephalus microplus]
MTRVPFEASFSPVSVSATLQHHLGHHHLSVCWYPDTWYLQTGGGVRGGVPVFADTATSLQWSFHVYDLIMGASFKVKALNIYRETNVIVADAGMELKK